MARTATPIEERFWQFVSPEPNTGCWLWTGAGGNYPKIWKNEHSRSYSAHRLSYEMYYGEIPDGMFVCHKCDNPFCVNPDHLYAGTAQTNMDDKMVRGRQHDQRGEKNPIAKLKAADIHKIRKLRTDGWTQDNIAKEFDIGRGYVGEIVRGEVWQHLYGK